MHALHYFILDKEEQSLEEIFDRDCHFDMLPYGDGHIVDWIDVIGVYDLGGSDSYNNPYHQRFSEDAKMFSTFTYLERIAEINRQINLEILESLAIYKKALANPPKLNDSTVDHFRYISNLKENYAALFHMGVKYELEKLEDFRDYESHNLGVTIVDRPESKKLEDCAVLLLDSHY